MMRSRLNNGALGALLAGLLAACCTGCATPSASPPPDPMADASPQRTVTGNWHAREGVLYQRNWGVDIIGVRRLSSGYMLRLNYRVVDPEKAKPLFDKKVRPFIIDEATGARLAIPAMENVGELRQTASPVMDKTYYMIFGNPEQLVKSGGRVSIVIGDLRVDGFIVD